MSLCAAFCKISYSNTKDTRRHHIMKPCIIWILVFLTARVKGWATDRTVSRRQAIVHAFVGASSILLVTDDGGMAEASDATTTYISGKAPIVPGQKPKSKDEVKGTKKDPSFLRSVADCKNQCLNDSSKTKEDCLSDCQDICCTTYEQCTFNIVPRI